MKTHWLILILFLLLTSCVGAGETSPSSTETPAPSELPAQVEETEMVSQQPTETSPTSAMTDTLNPTLPATSTPASISTIPPQPTKPPITLSDPAAIIAQVEGNANWFMLVGGSQMESWISAGEVAGVLGDNTEYQISTVDEYLGWVTAQEVNHELFCDQYFISVEPFSISETAVGVAGDWPLQPRKRLEINTDQEVYLQAVAAWLVEQAPSQPIVNINKIWRVDLEGNGTEEVILNATRFAEPTGHNVEPRDYSVILLRTVIGNQVVTIELVGDYYAEAVENEFPLTYNLEFIGDLNGDGIMEVVVGISRWEGTGVLVFEIDRDQVNLVLSVICHL